MRLAGLTFLLQLAGAVVLLLTVRELTRDRIATDAVALADVLRDDLLAAYDEGGVQALARMVAIRTAAGEPAGTVILLARSDGTPIQGNLGAWPSTVPVRAEGVRIRLYRRGRETPEQMQVSTARLRGGYRLLTGHVLEGQLRFASVMERASATALLLAVALAAGAAWATARIIERRLRRTVAAARSVEAGELGARVPVEGVPDAFDELARALNDMLNRIGALVGELKIATDGLAHDIKSPLTRMRSALERAALSVRDPAAQAAVERAMEESDRLLGIVETALRISRAEAGIGAESFVGTDVAALLEDVAEVYGPLAEDRGFTIDAAVPQAITLPLHRELMGQALANLVDNALKYGAGRIALAARIAGDGVVLSVSDQGPGIPPERRAEALRRFARLDEARAGAGAGLGLSLVAAVARLHGGTVALGDNAPGLLVEIALPSGRAGSGD